MTRSRLPHPGSTWTWEEIIDTEYTRLPRMQSVSTEGASPGGRRLSRSFHSCLRGADQDDLESGI